MTTDIMEACFERLNTFSYSPSPEILWPGKQETPPDSGIWLEAGFFPNEPSDLAWDNDACVDTRGFFQVLVYYRPGQGQVEPSEVADALIAHFPKGLEMSGVRVRKRPHQSPAIVDDASKIYIPVTIYYQGLT